MADKIRIGIIGLGRISTLHLAAYKPEQNLNVELVAVCDKDKKKGKIIAEEFNIDEKKVFTDYEELLKDNTVDAVEILTPHHFHTPMTIKAAEAGKHISLQKAPCMTLSEMDSMINATKKAEVKFRVFENFRFHPPYQKAMELINSGVIGKTIRVDYKMWSAIDSLSAWEVPLSAWTWRIREKSNYKSPTLFDDGYHKHSVIAKFLGEPIDSVLAWMGTYRLKGALKLDTPSVMIYSCKNKSHYGTWNTSIHDFMPLHSNYYGCDEYVDIIGEKGAIFIPGCTGNFFKECEAGPGKSGVHWVEKDGKWKSDTSMETDWGVSFINCSRAFVEGIRNDSDIELNPGDARYILQIALAIIRSSRNGFKEVKLKDIVDAP
ncbi:MAG: Gfo/Idh/MocA family oxidoreductase [archaeon]|nr:Gfo/Idh/MocA family oxidoreductase [archaeon]